MTRSLTLLALCIAVLLSVVTTAQAQYPVLMELYGRGVHAYNAGNVIDAHRYFSLAIDNGSTDPRVYYFRGVVHNDSGRPQEAEADWRRGAALESKGEYGLSIGRALARVQGSVRMNMEQIRQTVRLENRMQTSAREQARYNDFQAAEAEVLRGGKAAAPAAAIAPPAEVDESNNPFGNDAPAVDEPMADSSNNPFADDPAPADAGADFGAPAGDDNLFGAPAEENPFDTPADDAFGAPAAGDSMEPAAAPAAEPAAPAGDDAKDPFAFPEGDVFSN